MKYVFFNEDPNHFVFRRSALGGLNITETDLKEFINQYKETSITDFLICLNASYPWYNAKKTESIISKVEENINSIKANDSISWGGKLMYDIYKSGLNLHQIWIDQLKMIGIRPWISIRMNDIHGSSKKGDFLNGYFADNSEKYCISSYRGPKSYYDHALDYFKKEIRDYYYTIIDEALDTFDVYGIELDFLREIYSLNIGRIEKGVNIINSFLVSIKNNVKKYEKKYGHKIKIAIRLPSSIELSLRLGFDPFYMVENKLVDYIFVCPRWSSIDNNMPIDIWKKTFKNSKVKILSGLEILIDAYNRKPRKYYFNTLESAVGSCNAYYSMGSDGIYLFNYMDMADTSEKSSVLENRYFEFLKLVGNEKEVFLQNKRNIVTFCDVSATGYELKKQLPIKVTKDSVPALRIPCGKILKNQNVNVIIGVEKMVDKDTIICYTNGDKSEYVGSIDRNYPQYDDLFYYSFKVKNSSRLPNTFICEFITENEEPITIHWVEIAINNN